MLPSDRMADSGERMEERALVAMPIWDAHSCVPLHPDFDLKAVMRHYRNGARFVSINVGMDMNPLDQILTVIASFRRQLAAHPELFVPVASAADVARALCEDKLAVAFDLEGGIPLCGRPEMVFLFRDLGVRQIHLAYNRNNALGGGCYDEDVPLTPLGRRIVQAIYAAGLFMDLSHTGQRTSLDIVELGLGPVIFSHANPRALAPDRRCITEEQIRACAATGGVVCVTGVGRFLPDPQARTPAILACIDHLVERVGPRHVGLSLDFEYPAEGLDDAPAGLDRRYWWPPEFGYDGTPRGLRIATPEQLPEIAEGLAARGYDDDTIAAILFGNMFALARRLWR